MERVNTNSTINGKQNDFSSVEDIIKDVVISINNSFGNKILFKICETGIVKINGEETLLLETEGLNGCTAYFAVITNTNGEKFVIFSHFPPIAGFKDKQFANLDDILKINKTNIGNVSKITLLVATETSRNIEDYKTIENIILENLSVKDFEIIKFGYNKKNPKRCMEEVKGTFGISINKKEIIVSHEGKSVKL